MKIENSMFSLVNTTISKAMQKYSLQVGNTVIIG